MTFPCHRVATSSAEESFPLRSCFITSAEFTSFLAECLLLPRRCLFLELILSSPLNDTLCEKVSFVHLIHHWLSCPCPESILLMNTSFWYSQDPSLLGPFRPSSFKAAVPTLRVRDACETGRPLLASSLWKCPGQGMRHHHLPSNCPWTGWKAPPNSHLAHPDPFKLGGAPALQPRPRAQPLLPLVSEGLLSRWSSNSPTFTVNIHSV